MIIACPLPTSPGCCYVTWHALFQGQGLLPLKNTVAILSEVLILMRLHSIGIRRTELSWTNQKGICWRVCAAFSELQFCVEQWLLEESSHLLAWRLGWPLLTEYELRCHAGGLTWEDRADIQINWLGFLHIGVVFFSFHGLIASEGILAGKWKYPYSILHGGSLLNKHWLLIHGIHEKSIGCATDIVI